MALQKKKLSFVWCWSFRYNCGLFDNVFMRTKQFSKLSYFSTTFISWLFGNNTYGYTLQAIIWGSSSVG